MFLLVACQLPVHVMEEVLNTCTVPLVLFAILLPPAWHIKVPPFPGGPPGDAAFGKPALLWCSAVLAGGGYIYIS